MKKKLIMFSILLALISTVHAVSAYDASVDVVTSDLGRNDALTLYGYVDHATGSEDFYTTSSLKLRIYNAGTGPSDSVLIKSSNIDYQSDYDNPGELLLKGAFMADDLSLSLTHGETYYAEVVISEDDNIENSEVKGLTSFTYNESLYRNSTMSVNSYSTLGTLKARALIKKEDYSPDLIYDVEFYTPTINNVADNELGNPDETTTITLAGTNESDTLVDISASVLSEGMNVFIVQVTGTNASQANLIPEGYVKLWRSGEARTLPVDGSIILNDCSGKEESTEECEFTVENTGDYPASFNVEVDSDVNTEVEFEDDLMNPGDTITGIIKLKAVEGDEGTRDLTLTLKHGSEEVSELTESITISPRDLVNKVNITDFTYPRSIMEDEEISVSLEVTNTGDFEEWLRIKYTVDSVEYTRPYFNLMPGQSKIITIDGIIPPRGEEIVPIRVDVLNEDGTSMQGRITQVRVTGLTYTPYARWYNSYESVEQGDTGSNELTIENKGNTQTYYKVWINSDYASLDENVLLNPGESEELTIPIVVSEDSESGVETIDAEVCSLTSNTCYTSSFTLTIIEVEDENSTITVNQTVQALEGDEGAVFEITVENNEGRTNTYSLSTGSFNGDLRISPATLTILNGGSDEFYLYAKPEEQVNQNITYTVLKDDTVIRSGNLTLAYAPTGLTGLITLSEAGTIGAVILAMGVITVLIIWGVRALNQSKVELKYWK